MTLGEWLKEQREGNEVTQEAAARAAETTLRTWQRWENGERAWTFGLFLRATKAAGVLRQDAAKAYTRIEMGGAP